MHGVMGFLVRHGHVVVFISVFAESIGLPVPSVPVLLAAGALVGLHYFSLPAVAAWAFTACLLSDSIWFWLGRRRGSSVLEFICRIALEPDTCVSKTHSAYTRYGSKTLLLSKFIPGLSMLGPPMAGLFRAAPWKFLLFDAGGALLWSGAYIAIGWAFRVQLEDIVLGMSRFGGWFGVALVALVAGYVGYKFLRRRRIYHTLRADRITAAELKLRMDAGESPLIVDLRAEFERQEGWIPGAIALTLDDVASLTTVIGKREVIFYCSCPDEITSVRAALRLKRRGATRVHPLLGGFSGWRELGFPIEGPASRAAQAAP
ncbi:MAG TPA: VTT domain-containing protein [Bryobacteraceae bacterium]|nr:VTT domain-containing protein [Bryobacteraceae bacterium]